MTGWLTDGNPMHRLVLALAGSLALHGVAMLAAGMLPVGSPRGTSPHVFQVSLSYRADPVAIDETVASNDPEAVSPARLRTRPDDLAATARVFTLESRQRESQPAERALGLPGDQGGGDDCRITGFRFCSS